MGGVWHDIDQALGADFDETTLIKIYAEEGCGSKNEQELRQQEKGASDLLPACWGHSEVNGNYGACLV